MIEYNARFPANLICVWVHVYSITLYRLWVYMYVGVCVCVREGD